MLQAIRVKFRGPTNRQRARWLVAAAAGTITVPFQHAQSHDNEPLRAAQQLCKKLGWKNALAGGTLKDGSYVFVMLEGE
jgi:hypothetical protein